uniref:Histone deacetylase 10 n=1 Tax=Labrus bergylta TaxID=56723 RepID=A0A3Q3F7Z6_9LABR
MGTALIHDEEMTKYKLLWVDPACKIEVPERLTVTYEALIQNGLTDRCVSVPVREATDADILLVHRTSITVPSWLQGLHCRMAWLWSGEVHQ